MTQEQLAFASGLTLRTVQRAESDESNHNPSLGTLTALARALDVSVADLLAEDPQSVAS